MPPAATFTHPARHRASRSRASRPERLRELTADAVRDGNHRHVDVLAHADRTGRQLAAVEDDRLGAGAGGSLGASRGAAPPGTSAARPATLLYPRLSKNRAQCSAGGSSPGGVAGRSGCASSSWVASRGPTEPASGSRPVERRPDADPQHDADVLQARAEIGGGDRERRARASGAGDAPEADAGGAVVAGRRHDERVVAQRPRDRLRRRAVLEGAERLGHPQRARSARHRACRRRRSGRPRARGRPRAGRCGSRPRSPPRVPLPARYPHREDRGAWSDPREPARASRAGDEAGELGRVPLELDRSPDAARPEPVRPRRRRPRRRGRGGRGSDGRVDARVEERHGHAPAVEARKARLGTKGGARRNRRRVGQRGRDRRRIRDPHRMTARTSFERSSRATPRGSRAAEKPESTRV